MNYLMRRRKLGRTSCKGIVAASQTGLKVYRNDAALPEGGLVFRWGCTSDVPCKNVVNTAKAIHAVSDKTGFRQVLNEHELCPKTWFVIDDVQYPAVVRPRFHAQGKKLFLVMDQAALLEALKECGPGWYASAFINKTAEYRVYCAQGRVIAVASKTPKDHHVVAWNAAQGGHFSNVRWAEWPLRAVRVSLEAFGLSGLDFGAVDVMVDAEGNVFVLEINAAPSLTSAYRQAAFARVFDWIVQHGKDTIPLIAEKGGYKKFIHPAVCEGALVP